MTRTREHCLPVEQGEVAFTCACLFFIFFFLVQILICHHTAFTFLQSLSWSQDHTKYCFIKLYISNQSHTIDEMEELVFLFEVDRSNYWFYY